MNKVEVIETTGGLILGPVLENILLLQFSQHRSMLMTDEMLVHLKTGYFFILRGDAARDFLRQIGLDEYKDRIIEPIPTTNSGVPTVEMKTMTLDSHLKDLKGPTFFQSFMKRWRH